jgi:uncharacterized protein YcfJ
MRGTLPQRTVAAVSVSRQIFVMMQKPRSYHHAVGAVLGAFALLAGTPASSQQVIVYPTRNQSPEQSERDKGECNVWAQQQTGVNPMAPAPSAAPPPPPPTGGRVRGAARGAAVGAVGGAIGGDAGKGAAIGAAGGALIGGFRQRDQRRAQEEAYHQSQQQQAQQSQQASATFARAYAACLEGRGYTVK